MASLNPHTGVLGERLAAHLLRRSSYNITRARIENYALMTADAAVDALFSTPPLQLTEPVSGETGLPWINHPANPEPPQWKQKNYVKVWWLNEAYQDISITSKLMMFLHQYMTIHVDAADTAHIFDYLALLRLYAKGNYQELALKIITNNTMSDYLDNRWNHKWNPNENFAREFFELFTIGKGPQIGPGDYTNYTEGDVQEAARLLTGWRFGDRDEPTHTDPDTGLTRNFTLFNYHDTNAKTFSAALGNTTIQGATNDAAMWTELEQFNNMIFAQDATAVTLCRRLYRYFVSPDITDDIETDIIQPLASTCRNNNYDLSTTVKQLLKSQHFFNEGSGEVSGKVIGGMIKSPLDNVLQTMSFFNIEPPHPILDYENHYEDFWWWSVMDVMFEQAGFNFLEPNNVAGYPAYYQAPAYSRDWFNSATIIARYKIPEIFITGQRLLSWGTTGGVSIDFVDFVENSGVVSNPADANQTVDELCNFLFPEMPDASRLDYLVNDVFLAGLAPTEWTNTEWAGYQSSGDDSGVRIALERLFKGLVYAQENQLM